MEKEVFYKSIYEMKPYICKKIALCKKNQALSLIYPYAYLVIPFGRVRLDLLSTLYSPLLY